MQSLNSSLTAAAAAAVAAAVVAVALWRCPPPGPAWTACALGASAGLTTVVRSRDRVAFSVRATNPLRNYNYNFLTRARISSPTTTPTTSG